MNNPFDNSNRKIIKLEIDYHRHTKIKPEESMQEISPEYIIWDYTESIKIDRETQSLEHIQNIGEKCRVSRKYEIDEGIDSILDNFAEDGLFENIIGNPSDVVENSLETKDYTIMIVYDKGPWRIIKGTFDKKGLPDDFGVFIDYLWGFIRFYGYGEIFDPRNYNKQK